MIAGHPAIIEIAVIGGLDNKWGEVPIVVAAVADDELTVADLEKLLRDMLARNQHPKSLEAVDALPGNPSGKVLKGELRNRFTRADGRNWGESTIPSAISARE